MLDEYTFDKNEVIKLNFKDRFFNFNNKVIQFQGGYCSFSEASSASLGYDAEEIFNKSAQAALAVKTGQAKYERDSVLFYDNKKMFELLYAITSTYNTQGRVDILDYGGGMGSMYFQHREMLRDFNYTWIIKEQRKFVEYGNCNLADDILSFTEEMTSAINANMVILGSSLQYIEDAQMVLKEIIEMKPYIVFIDRTPVCTGGNNDSLIYGVFREIVHKPIYEAQYPMYVFDKDVMYNFMKNQGEYALVAEWKPNSEEQFRYKNKKICFESSMWRKI